MHAEHRHFQQHAAKQCKRIQQTEERAFIEYLKVVGDTEWKRLRSISPTGNVRKAQERNRR